MGVSCLIFKFLKRFYLIIWEKAREHKQGRGSERSGRPTEQGCPTWGLVPAPWDHNLSQRQRLNWLSPPDTPKCIFNKENLAFFLLGCISCHSKLQSSKRDIIKTLKGSEKTEIDIKHFSAEKAFNLSPWVQWLHTYPHSGQLWSFNSSPGHFASHTTLTSHFIILVSSF